MSGALTQVEAFRRGLQLAALLWTTPRDVPELCLALGLTARDVQRMIVALRSAPGVVIAVTEPVRYKRQYRMTARPEWMERAIRMLHSTPPSGAVFLIKPEGAGNGPRTSGD